MFPVIVGEIVKVTRGQLVKGDPKIVISDISTDSRMLMPGALFVCIEGTHFDGHFFIGEAIRKGAKGVIVTKRKKIKDVDKIPLLIEVEDTVSALSNIAGFVRRKFKGEMVAVTGSVGKTTTKDFIKTVLEQKYSVHASYGSYNNHIGIPLTMFGLEKEHDVCVTELGSNGFGQIKKLAEVVKPDVGIITKIGPAHIGYFGSLEGIIEEKTSMFDHIDSRGLAILNIDDEFFPLVNKKVYCRKLTVGFNPMADFEIVRTQGDMFYRIVVKPFSQILEIKLPVLGEHNVYSLVFAIAVGYGLGVGTEEIINGIQQVKLPKGRLQIKEVAMRKIINDSYNANPLSMEAALRALHAMETTGQKIFVCGDMLELGQWAEYYHKQVGQMVVKYGVDKLILRGRWAEDVKKGAIEAGFKSENIYLCKFNSEVVELLSEVLEPEDVVLIKGSHSMHMEEIVIGIEEYYKTLDSLIV